MKSHEDLVREAAAEDGARALLRAAGDLARVAGNFDDVSNVAIRRMVENLRTIAKLKRPKVEPRPVQTPDDVTRVMP